MFPKMKTKVTHVRGSRQPKKEVVVVESVSSDELTPRSLEVLKIIVDGWTHGYIVSLNEVAKRLNRRAPTVYEHALRLRNFGFVQNKSRRLIPTEKGIKLAEPMIEKGHVAPTVNDVDSVKAIQRLTLERNIWKELYLADESMSAEDKKEIEKSVKERVDVHMKPVGSST